MSNMTQTTQTGNKQNGLNSTAQSFSPNAIISICGDGDLLNARFTVDEKMKRPGKIYIQDRSNRQNLQTSSSPKDGHVHEQQKENWNIWVLCLQQHGLRNQSWLAGNTGYRRLQERKLNCCCLKSISFLFEKFAFMKTVQCPAP